MHNNKETTIYRTYDKSTERMTSPRRLNTAKYATVFVVVLPFVTATYLLTQILTMLVQFWRHATKWQVQVNCFYLIYKMPPINPLKNCSQLSAVIDGEVLCGLLFLVNCNVERTMSMVLIQRVSLILVSRKWPCLELCDYWMN